MKLRWNRHEIGGECTDREVSVFQFPGDHFYFVDQSLDVAKLVVSKLQSVSGGR